MKLRILPAALLLLAIGCASTSPMAAIEQRTHAYAQAVQHESPRVIAAFYAAEGALVLPGMEPIVGPGRVEAFLKPLVANTEVTSCEMTTTSLRVAGGTAHQEGTYSQVGGHELANELERWLKSECGG
jgi:ketosteroid isomerase-like protein